MHGHTGFLLTTRRLAPGVVAPVRKRRPAKGAYDVPAEADWDSEDLGERSVSDKRVRRIRRSVTGQPPPS